MRLCLDLQGAQTASRYRGIGRYSLGFARALAARASAHDVHVVLNGSFASTIEPIRAMFADLVPANNFAIFDTPGAVSAETPRNDWRGRIAEPMREAFLAGLAPDVVHVSSMFEGWLDDAVTSIGTFDDGLVTTTTLYDLIPFIRHEEYLADKRYRGFYMRKLEFLKLAQIMFAISESSRKEAIDALGLHQDQVIAIGCGVDSVFSAQGLPSDGEALRQRCGIPQPYVLYTGGFDARKNVHRLIEAYGRLSDALRRRHMLVIGGRVTASERGSLLAIGRNTGVSTEAIVFTGEVEDSVLAALYRRASLFVFPSLHEGFGLPAAEAMASGTPVIASRTSSLPEVIGRADALFDPTSVDDIAKLMTQALSDEAFRNALSRHGLERSQQFSWEACAARALPALEHLHARSGKVRRLGGTKLHRRPRLAYVSPVPPERTGIADYSAGLLPELARHYEIDVVIDQEPVASDWNTARFPLRTIDWFGQHAHDFDHILYHIGNSPFHRRMIQVAKVHVGTVVLHDFYLTGLLRWLEEYGGDATALRRALYASHGYIALLTAKAEGLDVACARFPASREVIESAGGVIVHSQHAADLTRKWYGDDAVLDVAVVPLYAPNESPSDRSAARAKLQIPGDAFVVCSFGFLAPTKLNHRLLAGWEVSGLAADTSAWLIYVGENEGGEYGRQLAKSVEASDATKRIRITGYLSDSAYGEYLAAADVAVQLRTMSRGETSWAVLRCMAHGLPTIVNAHGAAAEYLPSTVLGLPDEFTDAEIGAALRSLRNEPELRSRLHGAAIACVANLHAPALVAKKYHDAIERFANGNGRIREQRLVRSIAEMTEGNVTEEDLISTARAIGRQRPAFGQHQLLVDVSVVARNDLRSGIERVVRGVLMELLRNPPEGYRTEAIRDDGFGRYVYARQYVLGALELSESLLQDDPVEVRKGDLFVGLDWYADGIPRVAQQLIDWRNHGVKIHFVIYDLLPVLMPHAFPESSLPLVRKWLSTIAQIADGLICISRSVADELKTWLDSSPPARASKLQIGYFRLGSTFAETLPTRGIAADLGPSNLKMAAANPAFLMVGTVEPRKAHGEVVAAFDILWRSGLDLNLVIVGRQGWMMDALATILRSHPENEKRLFWYTDASDELLEQLYSTSTALIAASHGEGFGLPIVEAARHGLPVIARDIPVFREVAGNHAHYFSGDGADDLANVLRGWLDDYQCKKIPDSRAIEILDWARSTATLVNVVIDGDWYWQWQPQCLSVAPAREVESDA